MLSWGRPEATVTVGSGVVCEDLSQDGESGTERLNGAGQRGGSPPLAWFQSDAVWLPGGGALLLPWLVSKRLCRLRQVEQDVSELLSVLSVTAAAVQSCWVQRVSLCVEDEAPGPQNTLPSLTALLPGAHPLRPPTVQEVSGVEEQVKVLDSFSEEERLHPVVQLVVSQVFNLQDSQTHIHTHTHNSLLWNVTGGSYTSISTGGLGDLLYGLQSIEAKLQVGVVTCGPEQVHGALY